MNVLKKLFLNKKIRVVTESAKVNLSFIQKTTFILVFGLSW